MPPVLFIPKVCPTQKSTLIGLFSFETSLRVYFPSSTNFSFGAYAHMLWGSQYLWLNLFSLGRNWEKVSRKLRHKANVGIELQPRHLVSYNVHEALECNIINWRSQWCHFPCTAWQTREESLLFPICVKSMRFTSYFVGFYVATRVPSASAHISESMKVELILILERSFSLKNTQKYRNYVL